jgi:hypothetical protein
MVSTIFANPPPLKVDPAVAMYDCRPTIRLCRCQVLKSFSSQVAMTWILIRFTWKLFGGGQDIIDSLLPRKDDIFHGSYFSGMLTYHQ